MGTDVRTALDRLRAAASSGELDELCEVHGARLLAAFGRATRTDGEPADLDLAVRFEDDAGDLLRLLEDLSRLAGTDHLDVMDLGRADPVARERGLVGGVPLFESERGVFARAQMAAMLERMDTAWLRDLDLDAMAG